MSDLLVQRLPEPLRPLLDKFYRHHRSPMRRPPQAQAWVAKQGDIVAALCLTAIGDGHWLTGLFVAPAWRGQGMARRLVEQAVAACEGPLWLFCHPDLTGFYNALGFKASNDLPAELLERLLRYQRSKPLVAMTFAQSSALGSRSGNKTSVKPN